LLVYNPYWLWDVGFQLSYLAVGGIVLLQKPIENLLYVWHPWLRKIWSLNCVTLAAQLATTPVCLYYFHQFPTLFFISNLLIVPLSTLILGLELLLLLFSWQAQLLQCFGWLSGWSIRLMNQCILHFNNLSFSLIDGLYFDGWMLACAYGFLVAAGYGWLRLQRSSLWLSACFALLGLITWNIQCVRHARQSMIIVYHVPKRLAIDVVEGNNYCFVGDSSWQQAAYLVNFHLKPNRIARQLDNCSAVLSPIDCRNHILHWNNERWLITDSLSSPPEQVVYVDRLVLANKTKQSLEEWTKTVRTNLLIIDASNSLWKIEQWKTAAGKLNLPCFSVPEQGAFVGSAPE
jgi:competence protein ComEC